jgi:hypothetical protein
VHCTEEPALAAPGEARCVAVTDRERRSTDVASSPHLLSPKHARSSTRGRASTPGRAGAAALHTRRVAVTPLAARSALASWAAAAWALPSDHFELRVPLETVLEEAQTAVGFFERHWPARHDPRTGRLVPGLCAAGAKRLPQRTGREVVALRDAVRAAQRDYLLAIDPTAQRDLFAEAREVLCELAYGLEWLIDELAGPEHRVPVETLLAMDLAVPDTPVALADALASYAGLAALYEKQLRLLPEFPPGLLAHARGLADALRGLAEATQTAAGADAAQGPARALALRNRLLTLLGERVERIRRAARLVYRNHPGIYRQIAGLGEAQRHRGRASASAARDPLAPARGARKPQRPH